MPAPMAIACAFAAAMIAALAGSAPAATSSSVVGATVLSATSIGAGACASGSAATSLGSLAPGGTAVTPDECTVSFGSSNDTASLRLRQGDGLNRAMWRVTDGSLASSGWGTGGIGSGAAAWDAVEAVLRLPDGSVLVGGDVGNVAQVLKLGPTGAVDGGFGSGGTYSRSMGADDHVFAMLRQPSGKIVVAGRTWGLGTSTNDAWMLRLTATGTLDGSFGSGGVVNISHGAFRHESIAALFEASDGSLRAVGWDNGSVAQLAYTADGAPLTSWGTSGEAFINTGADIDVVDALMQPDGKVVAVGSGDTYDDYLFARFNANGSPDMGFGTSGVRLIEGGTDEDVLDAALDPSGRIVWVGASGSGAQAVVGRLTAAGLDDGTFRGGGRFLLDPAVGNPDHLRNVEVLPDGRIQAMGRTTVGGSARVWVPRFASTGADDTEALTPVLTSTFAPGVATLGDDGSITVAGRTATNLPGAARLVGVTVPDYVQGSTAFASTGGADGGCLEVATGASTADWAAAGDEACLSGTAAAWHAVPASSPGARLASTASTATGSVDLRFGFRAGSSQQPGTYLAPVTFEVVAPAA